MNTRTLIDFTKNQSDELASNPKVALTKICEYLKQNVKHYDWVGFYFHDVAQPKLILKAFAGEPTEHVEIPFGKGICGQVAESNANFRVDDVDAQDNYIACDIYTKSELVVPVFIDGKNVGQIDIDSNQKNAFSNEDEDLLKAINEVIAQHLNLTLINA